MSNRLVGNAPCSWGTLEFGSTEGDRFTFSQVLDEVVATGYTGCELGDWGFMPTDPGRLASDYRARKLAMTGAFVGVNLKSPDAHAQGEVVVLNTARLIADVAQSLTPVIRPFLVLADDNGTDPMRTQNAGRVTAEMALDEDQWQVFAKGAERLAKTVLDETGLHTVFHHHCAGYIETPQEIQRLMEMTDPDVLGLVFDTGHYSFGAGSCETVIDAMERLADRIWYVHLKDCHPQIMRQSRQHQWDYFEAVRQGVFCELGEGCVNFAAVRNWLDGQSYGGYLTVEQDVLPGMGSPQESAQRNREFLHSIGI